MHATRKLAYAVLPLAIAAGAFAAAGPAAATTPEPECKTVTTTMTDRADSGLHGDWAKDNFTRTVRFCETAPAPAAEVTATDVDIASRRSVYTATVTDEGTFTTVAGKSPVAGVDLAAGITGRMAGHFAATFKAAPGFKHFQSTLEDAYADAAGPGTPQWIEAAWGGKDLKFLTNQLADNKGWEWTYWTCSATVDKATEKWRNAAPDVNTGDITGKVACPTPAPTSPPTTAPTSQPAADPVATHSSTPAATPSLPVTGSSTPTIVGSAIVLVALGGGVLLITRRRRTAA